MSDCALWFRSWNPGAQSGIEAAGDLPENVDALQELAVARRRHRHPTVIT
ncbi:hypothetical protein ACFSDA_06280 [Brachybacterium rhamnosum]|uniref:Uncharacterized protein n=1 Tax=Brachybacterium rhamnosum TaxID=173361 RepID=A0ABW4PX10_9MICO|nr:hypothetical protein [Brachybacterium sp. SGAir0954]